MAVVVAAPLRAQRFVDELVAVVGRLAKLGLRRIVPTVLISTAPPDQALAALCTVGYPRP
ncbi:hypothetical protein [Streptomyces sp. NPDC002537]